MNEVLTVKQFLRLPEIKPALEFIQGRVIQKAPPNTSHSVIQTMLSGRISEHLEPRKLGQPYLSLRCTFGGDSLVPEIAYFAPGRIPKDRRGRYVEDIFLAPDLAVEIASPPETIKELTSKMSRAVRNGVVLGWLIQPSGERVLVFRGRRPVEKLQMGDALDGEQVLPEFVLPLEELFGWLKEY